MLNCKSLLLLAAMSLAVGCASQKTKRQIKETREENVLSCRYIGTVSGSSNSDALAQAATLDLATHIVWTGKGSGKVYSCD